MIGFEQTPHLVTILDCTTIPSASSTSITMIGIIGFNLRTFTITATGLTLAAIGGFPFLTDGLADQITFADGGSTSCGFARLGRAGSILGTAIRQNRGGTNRAAPQNLYRGMTHTLNGPGYDLFAGDDVATAASSKADTLFGGKGDDLPDAGARSGTSFSGASGNDVKTAGSGGSNSMAAGSGIDTASRRSFATSLILDLVAPPLGSDSLTSIENVIGGSHANAIIGNGKAKLLSDGFGSDTMTGGTGADTFQFVVVTDLSTGFRDVILDVVTGLDKAVLLSGWG